MTWLKFIILLYSRVGDGVGQILSFGDDGGLGVGWGHPKRAKLALNDPLSYKNGFFPLNIDLKVTAIYSFFSPDFCNDSSSYWN